MYKINNINDPDIDEDIMLEVCVCGDYRINHENGKGKCRMPNDITHGYQECKTFKKSPTKVTRRK